MGAQLNNEFHLGRDLMRRLFYAVDMFRALAGTYQNEDGTFRNETKFLELHKQADNMQQVLTNFSGRLLDANSMTALDNLLDRLNSEDIRPMMAVPTMEHIASYISDYDEGSSTLGYFRSLHNERVRNEAHERSKN